MIKIKARTPNKQMAVDKIVKESWDEELDGLRWVRESGDETTVFRAQGLDIVVIQTRDGNKHTAWCYSEPGLLLFSAMLKYHVQTGTDMPPLEEIQHVFGQAYDRRECGYPVDRIGMDFILKNDFPVAEDGRIMIRPGQMVNPVGGYMGGKGYFAFMEDDAFWISVPDSGDKLHAYHKEDGKLEEGGAFFRSIKLYPECALRVMKAINLFYPDKEFLASAYRQALEQKEDWIYKDIR